MKSNWTAMSLTLDLTGLVNDVVSKTRKRFIRSSFSLTDSSLPLGSNTALIYSNSLNIITNDFRFKNKGLVKYKKLCGQS